MRKFDQKIWRYLRTKGILVPGKLLFIIGLLLLVNTQDVAAQNPRKAKKELKRRKREAQKRAADRAKRQSYLKKQKQQAAFRQKQIEQENKISDRLNKEAEQKKSKQLLEEQKQAALIKSKARKTRMQEMDTMRATKVKPNEF